MTTFAPKLSNYFITKNYGTLQRTWIGEYQRVISKSD